MGFTGFFWIIYPKMEHLEFANQNFALWTFFFLSLKGTQVVYYKVLSCNGSLQCTAQERVGKRIAHVLLANRPVLSLGYREISFIICRCGPLF